MDKTKKPTSNAHDEASGFTKQAENRMAVVDLGGNTFRLSIFEKSAPHKIEEIFSYKNNCAIGKYDANGDISNEAYAAALDALAEIKSQIKDYNIPDDNIIAIATGGVRNAANGDDFLKDAEQKLGHPIRRFSPEDEARYAGMGVINAFDQTKKYSLPNHAISLDLGGSSLETCELGNNQIDSFKSKNTGFNPMKAAYESGDLDDFITQNMPENLFDASAPDHQHSPNLCLIGGAWRDIATIIAKKKKTQTKKAIRQISKEKIEHGLSDILGTLYQFGWPCLSDAHFSSKGNAEYNQLKNPYKDLGIEKNRLNKLFFTAKLLQKIVQSSQPDHIYFVEAGMREAIAYEHFLSHDNCREAPEKALEKNKRKELTL